MHMSHRGLTRLASIEAALATNERRMDSVVNQIGEISSASLCSLQDVYTSSSPLTTVLRCRHLDRRTSADQAGRRQPTRHKPSDRREPPVPARCKPYRQHRRANPYSTNIPVARSSTALYGWIARIRLDLAIRSDLAAAAAAAADILDFPSREHFQLTVSAPPPTNESLQLGRSWLCARRVGPPRLVGVAGRAPLRVAYEAAHSGFAGCG